MKVAQAEEFLTFPQELDAPWEHLQRSFGLTSTGGNITSNVLLNVNERGERVFKINMLMSEVVQSSEDAFYLMFHGVELAVRCFLS